MIEIVVIDDQVRLQVLFRGRREERKVKVRVKRIVRIINKNNRWEIYYRRRNKKEVSIVIDVIVSL